jgi:hypothetical protein
MLRDHPLMSYRGVSSWPPAWHWLGERINRFPKGEAGVLNEVRIPVTDPFNRCFLIIEYKKAMYMGCLLIDDLRFAIKSANYCSATAASLLQLLAVWISPELFELAPSASLELRWHEH